MIKPKFKRALRASVGKARGPVLTAPIRFGAAIKAHSPFSILNSQRLYLQKGTDAWLFLNIYTTVQYALKFSESGTILGFSSSGEVLRFCSQSLGLAEVTLVAYI